jgi:hypothetical protein
MTTPPQPITTPPANPRGRLCVCSRGPDAVCRDSLGGGRYPYAHDPHAEHDLPNTAIPLHWAVPALAIGLVWIAYRTLRGWS